LEHATRENLASPAAGRRGIIGFGSDYDSAAHWRVRSVQPKHRVDAIVATVTIAASDVTEVAHVALSPQAVRAPVRRSEIVTEVEIGLCVLACGCPKDLESVQPGLPKSIDLRTHADAPIELAKAHRPCDVPLSDRRKTGRRRPDSGYD